MIIHPFEEGREGNTKCNELQSEGKGGFVFEDDWRPFRIHGCVADSFASTTFSFPSLFSPVSNNPILQTLVLQRTIAGMVPTKRRLNLIVQVNHVRNLASPNHAPLRPPQI
jgi:hypothetical protein